MIKTEFRQGGLLPGRFDRMPDGVYDFLNSNSADGFCGFAPGLDVEETL
jgi:hypothetical protein